MPNHLRAAWLAYVVAIATFVAGLVIALFTNETLGVVALTCSLIIACTTFLADRIEGVERRVLFDLPVLQAIQSEITAGTPAAIFLASATTLFLDQATAISQGRVPVPNATSLIQGKIEVTKCARRTIHAVDQITLDKWLTLDQLQVFLKAQADAGARGVTVHRLRIVDEALLVDPEYLRKLRSYRDLQEGAGIQLKFCRKSLLAELGLSRLERGWLLADRNDSTRVSGTYGILSAGEVIEGAIFLKESSETRGLSTEYDTLAQSADLPVFDKLVRERLDGANVPQPRVGVTAGPALGGP